MESFKAWLLLSEEIYQNRTATVYHRTNSKNLQNILANNWQVGGGRMYGAGLYTTFALESQFTNYSGRYGPSILKFKVTDLDKYVICHKSVAQQILGSNYKISDQLKNLNLSDLYNEKQIQEFDQMMEKGGFSGPLALKMYEANTNLAKRAKGIIFYGSNDGYVLVKYEPIEDNTITLLGYVKNARNNDIEKMKDLASNCHRNQEGKCENPWVTSTEQLNIRSLYKLPVEKKSIYTNTSKPYTLKDFLRNKNSINNLNDDEFRLLTHNLKNLDLYAKIIIQNKKELSKDNVINLLDNAENTDEMAKIIIQNKKELPNSIDYLMDKVTNKDEIAKLIIVNKLKLFAFDIITLLRHSTNPDQMAKELGENIHKLSELNDDTIDYFMQDSDNKDAIAKIIIQYKKELSDDNVSFFMQNSEKKDADAIAKLIIQKKPELSDSDVNYLMMYSDNKFEIAKLIIQKKPELSDIDVNYLMIYLTQDLDKMAEIANTLGQKNINKLDVYDVNELFNKTDDKEKIAQILGEYNINKLDRRYIYYILNNAQYHEIYLGKEKEVEKVARILRKENLKKLNDSDIDGYKASRYKIVLSILQKYGIIP